jgi:cytochrome P450
MGELIGSIQAVIWEGLRMRPPVTLGVYKVLPVETTLCGVPLPAGTAVGFNAIAMMRRKDVFGQDSQLFRPERFLECDNKTKTERINTVELAFGYGRWMCAGKTLAMMELNKIFFEVSTHRKYYIYTTAPAQDFGSIRKWLTRSWLGSS